MIVCKLRTLFCVNYEHFHVYLAYRRQTGTVVTRQTYDRAPRLTRPPTAHISRGVKAYSELQEFPLVDLFIVQQTQWDRGSIFRDTSTGGTTFSNLYQT